MIAIPNNEKGLRGKSSSKPFQQVSIVGRGHFLSANVFVDHLPVARIIPIRRQFRAQPLVPGEMVGDRIDVDEQRTMVSFAFDHVDSAVKIEAVAFEVARSQIPHVEIMRYAGRCLKAARIEKGTVKRIQAEGLIATLIQQARQSTIYATGRDPRHRGRKAAERSNGKTRQHVEFREPAWAANSLHDKPALLAVERSKMPAIAGRHLHAGGR